MDGMGNTTEDSVVFPAFDILVTHIKRLIKIEKLASSVLAVSRHHAYSAYEIFDTLQACSTKYFLAQLRAMAPTSSPFTH
jgi:hypothetical protein